MLCSCQVHFRVSRSSNGFAEWGFVQWVAEGTRRERCNDVIRHLPR